MGQITNETLGEVEINSKPANVHAFFSYFGHKDLYLEGQGGIWPKNIDRNKLAIIEKVFIHKFLGPKLKLNLSEGEIQL